MKNLFVKMLSTSLAVGICFSLSGNALAASNEKNTNSYSSKGNAVIEVTSDSLNALTNSSTLDEATSDAADAATSDATNESMEADYTYKFAPQKKNPKVANVSVSLKLDIGGEIVPVKASGTVDANELSSGEILWEGPLDGSTLVNGVECSVIVGFAKLNTRQEAQMSITIQPNDNPTDEDNSIVFLIKGDVVTLDIHEELADSANISSLNSQLSQNSQKATLMAADQLQYKGGHVTPYNASSIYFSKNTNRAAVSAKSYTNSVNNKYLPNAYACATYVKDLTIQLQRSGTGTSYIANMEQFAFTSFGREVTLNPLLEDAMSLIGIPTSTISALLSSLKGSVSKDIYANNGTVTIKFGLTQYAKFDNTGGVPIVFQLAKSGSLAGPTTYNGITKIKYRTEFIPKDLSSSMYYIYTDSSTATGSASLTLS